MLTTERRRGSIAYGEGRMKTVIYAIFMCYYGVNLPCHYVPVLPEVPPPTRAECLRTARDMNAHNVSWSGPVVTPYVCMSRTVTPQWGPVE